MSSYTSSITIEELKSSDRSVTRTLTLTGGGLPLQGANWPIEATLPTTWYPGNPFEATQQVLVTKEMPSHWQGEWNLTILNRAPCRFVDAVQGSDDLVESPGLLDDIFSDLARKGQRLRVTWTVASDDPRVKRTIVREGRIRHFDPKYQRSTDVTWVCEWAWVSRGGTQQKVVAAREEDVDAAANAMIAAANAAILAANAKLKSAIDGVDLSATVDTLGQLESLATGVQELVQNAMNQLGRVVRNFTQLGDLVLKFAELPFNVANTAVSFAHDTLAQGNQFVDEIGLLPWEVTTTSNNVADLTRAATYFGQVGDAVSAANRQALTTGGQIRDLQSKNPGRGAQSTSATSATRDGALLGIYRTRQGDTPQSVSVRFYGTPDQDVAILKANQLPWYTVVLDPGTILLIPLLNGSTGP